MDTYVYYAYGNQLYLKLTNRCCNRCDFCIRQGREGLEGHRLWIEQEPDFYAVKAQLPKNLEQYKEIVICGFGEPTYNLDTLVKIGRFLKVLGHDVRLNTNGMGNLIHGRDITDDLLGAVDTVSISLNASNAEKYQEICHCVYGKEGYESMLQFAALCKEKCYNVVLSVVDSIGEDEIQKCRTLCKTMDLPLRVRPWEK